MEDILPLISKLKTLLILPFLLCCRYDLRTIIQVFVYASNLTFCSFKLHFILAVVEQWVARLSSFVMHCVSTVLLQV